MMIYVLLTVLGLVFGSFYLVVATRLPKEESLVVSRSHCDNCKHVLKWYELIPIFSYLIQGGKCRKCGCHIPFITVLVEIITGVLFPVSYYLYGFSYEFYALIILFSLAIIIFISDFEYYIINNEPLFTAIILILVLKYIYFGWHATCFALLSGLILFVTFCLVKLFGDKTFKKESLGGGDIKLSILIGITLGIKLGLTAFVLSAFLALPYAVHVSIKDKDSIVPYGPFLILALVSVFMFMDVFSNLLKLIFNY